MHWFDETLELYGKVWEDQEIEFIDDDDNVELFD